MSKIEEAKRKLGLALSSTREVDRESAIHQALAALNSIAANKAAEEGGLPVAPWTDRESAFETPEFNKMVRMESEIEDWRNYFSASRQVANKAEVEPVAHLKFWARQSWSGNGNHDVEYAEGLEVCKAGEIGDDGEPAFPVYATPPATTGASTVLTVDHNQWAHVAYAEDGKLHWMSGRKFDNCELYARYPSAPASTVLTDERIEELFKARGGRWQGGDDEGFWLIEDADLHPFVRYVAAQAGQVAVPSDLFDAAEALIEILDTYHEQLVPINRNSTTVKWLRKALTAPSPAKESK